jgi:hypothetical protein
LGRQRVPELWSHDSESTWFWLSLRSVVSGDPYSGIDSGCRAIGDLRLYAWVDLDGTVSIDLWLCDAGFLTLQEGVLRVKLLRRLHAKAPSLPVQTLEDRLTGMKQGCESCGFASLALRPFKADRSALLLMRLRRPTPIRCHF